MTTRPHSLKVKEKIMNIKNVQVVKFKDGTYAIRRGWFSYAYRDLRPGENQWWIQKYPISFQSCKGTLDETRKALEQLKNKRDVGAPVQLLVEVLKAKANPPPAAW